MRRPSNRASILWTLALTAGIEVVTAVMRFGLGIRSPEVTASTIGALLGGLRVHHAYPGVILVLVSLAAARFRPGPARILLIVGSALVLSDLIHHFLIIWPIVGSPEFDLFYPAAP